MQASDFSRQPPDAIVNQPSPLADYNLFADDAALREALAREGAGWAESAVFAYGERLGRSECLRLGELANQHPPRLQTHDRYGHRIDEIEFHPAWHELLGLAVRNGDHALAWTDPRSGAHVARCAMNMLRHQLDEGVGCPITMTAASVPAMRCQPEISQQWEPRILSNRYDPRALPAEQKHGVLVGMAMTERQGGSDVRANSSRAEAIQSDAAGRSYVLTGHKWFCSAPMSDAFLVLAQAPGGISCFLLPRFLPDGTRNAMQIVRLKDKLGNRSNASSEVEFNKAWAQLLGEEGAGVRTIIEMVRHTRLDCAFGSAATLRRAVAEATHHAAHRHAFGKLLIDQPLMQNVLADLCLESEAATAVVMRLARSFDRAGSDEGERSFGRIATPIIKYWVTKRAIGAVAEALECLGGNGYVEQGPLARLYRDVPLNALWEGAANVQCLDVLRAMQREPAVVDALLSELQLARGADRRYDAFVGELTQRLRGEPADLPYSARRIVGHIGLALQANLLLRHAPPSVADAFCLGRLSASETQLFGALPAGIDCSPIIERARPKLD